MESRIVLVMSTGLILITGSNLEGFKKHQNNLLVFTDVDEVAGVKRGANIVDRSSSLASEGVGVCWAWHAKLRALKLNW